MSTEVTLVEKLQSTQDLTHEVSNTWNLLD